MTPSFAKVEHGTSFDCEFIHIKVTKIYGIYKCIAANLTVYSEDERIVGVGGLHKSENTNENVQIFIIENQVCHYLPKDLNLRFPNVYHLDVRNSGLKAINGERMEMFPKLRHLYVRNNPIEALPENLFEHNLLLESMDLSDNRIKTVESNVFETLTKLIVLNIERNQCIDGFAFEEDSLRKLKVEIYRKCSN
jgi:Leucine-rich repeat (LRR) protein